MKVVRNSDENVAKVVLKKKKRTKRKSINNFLEFFVDKEMNYDYYYLIFEPEDDRRCKFSIERCIYERDVSTSVFWHRIRSID